mmetsp:Transcript_5168/g.14807  ORF Transcript_5168/g.14807 Transcript_5168/m.14807 type:complete len:234 (-) Transcript_5168:50-751(-)
MWARSALRHRTSRPPCSPTGAARNCLARSEASARSCRSAWGGRATGLSGACAPTTQPSLPTFPPRAPHASRAAGGPQSARPRGASLDRGDVHASRMLYLPRRNEALTNMRCQDEDSTSPSAPEIAASRHRWHARRSPSACRTTGRGSRWRRSIAPTSPTAQDGRRPPRTGRAGNPATPSRNEQSAPHPPPTNAGGAFPKRDPERRTAEATSPPPRRPRGFAVAPPAPTRQTGG